MKTIRMIYHCQAADVGLNESGVSGVIAGVITRFLRFEWRFYALSASKAIFRARTYNCITYSVR